MFLHLHKLRIALQSEDVLIQQQWQQLLAGWIGAAETADMTLQLQLTNELPPLPAGAPFFTDSHHLPDSVGILSAYEQAGGVLLHYLDGGLVQVPLTAVPHPCASGVVLPAVMAYGRFEDVTFTSLAPLLRRRGYYLVHAFAACKDGRCVLIVGPSGSGKTTTGLSLLLAGWQLLSNDMVLLEERRDGVYALPTPGGVSIRQQSLTLLPGLQAIIGDIPLVNGKYELIGQQLVNGRWPEAARITAVYFPQIEERQETAVSPHSPALCLAQLMEESMDRWDGATFMDHMNILQKISQQAAAYRLHLSPNLSQLSAIIKPVDTLI
jgi:hypothetical protein